jgi:ribose transport system ATP-binding protein
MTNTNLVIYETISRFGIIDGGEEKRRARKYIGELNIKTPSIYQKVKKLSGGNQQKVVVSKWLNAESNIFIFDEPTVGVDVGAKLEIYRLFENLTSQGASIILISSYLPEVMGLAKRIVVMYEGNCTGIVNKNEVTDEDVLRLASGLPAVSNSSK